MSVEVEVSDPRDPKRGGWIPVGIDGSYQLTGVPDNRFVKITDVDANAGRAGGYQFCATNTITHGDTRLDVPLFLPGAAVPSPTLSGRIFVVIDGKPTPLAGANVYYATRAYGPDVYGYTDRDGRYSLCGIPSMPGTLTMYCGNDTLIYKHVFDIRTDTVQDIDATTFYKCLALPTSK